MPTITTWNVNGMRAALRKGLGDWIDAQAPSVLMLQEVRALPEQLPAQWRAPAGWHVTWHPAEKKGYSGVATLTRGAHEVLGRGLPGHDDPEGRVLQVRWEGIRMVNVYLPSGSSGDERQAVKERWMEDFLPFAADLARLDEPVILVGDLNIAHTANDIWNPGGNKKNSGYLPHEREWFTRLLATGWIDAHRRAFGDVKGPYTWWSTRGQARAKDRGWRIDYALCNAAMAARIQDVQVDRKAGVEISDHAPISVQVAPQDSERPHPSSGDLDGSVVLITGGAGALAGPVAEAFAAAGAHIVLLDVRAPTARAQALGGHAITADLLDEAAVKTAVEQAITLHGRLDHVVHTVGGFVWGRADEASVGDYDRMMDLNVRSLFLVGRAVLPHLRSRGRGSLTAVSAGQAYRGGSGDVALYAGAKSAVSAWIRSVDEELAGTDVQATCLYPMGVIDTPANREAMPDADPAGWIDPHALARALVFAATSPRRGRVRDLPVFPGRGT